MSRCTAWTHSSARPTDRRWCPVYCLNSLVSTAYWSSVMSRCTAWTHPSVRSTDRRWSWFVGSKADEGRRWSFVCSIVVQRDYVTVWDSNIDYSSSVVIHAVVPNRTDVQTQYAVRHNTSILYSAVLHVSAHQNPLLQQFQNGSTFATCKCTSVSETRKFMIIYYSCLLQFLCRVCSLI